MTLHTRKDGAWAKVNGLLIRQSGVWTPVKNAYVRDGGVWKIYYSSEIVVEVTTNQTGLVLSTLFSTADWQSDTPKRVVIAAGVVISSAEDGVALAAKNGGSTSNEWGGVLTLDNYGIIQGLGGAANSGIGGSALYEDTVSWSKSVIVNNYGTIRAGGGGGGVGGSGSVTTSVRDPASGFTRTASRYWNSNGSTNIFGIAWDGAIYDYKSPSTATAYDAGGGVVFYRGGIAGSSGAITYYFLARQGPVTTPTTGGSGGRGQGSDGAAAAGSAGGPNAGTGGSGGDWGANGSAGAAGNVGSGVAGGLAGIAYTAAKWSVNNQGTIQGRVL